MKVGKIRRKEDRYKANEDTNRIRVFRAKNKKRQPTTIREKSI